MNYIILRFYHFFINEFTYIILTEPFPLQPEFGAQNSTLTIQVLKNEGIGTYRCLAQNTHGKDTKDFILKQQSPPVFTTRPKENIIAPESRVETLKLIITLEKTECSEKFSNMFAKDRNFK